MIEERRKGKRERKESREQRSHKSWEREKERKKNRRKGSILTKNQFECLPYLGSLVREADCMTLPLGASVIAQAGFWPKGDQPTDSLTACENWLKVPYY